MKSRRQSDKAIYTFARAGSVNFGGANNNQAFPIEFFQLCFGSKFRLSIAPLSLVAQRVLT